jgi:hypothetical protein
MALNQYHVGGQRPDLGPKYASGVISTEGKRVREDDENWSVQPKALSRADLLRPKRLYPDSPVTGILSQIFKHLIRKMAGRTRPRSDVLCPLKHCY